MDNLPASIGETLFLSSPDLIFVTDKNGTLIRVSPSSLELLGYEPAEMVGHVASEFLYGPDLEPTREAMRKARHGDGMKSFPCRYVHKDGTVVSLSWSGTWVDDTQHHYFIGRQVPASLQLIEKIDMSLRSIHARLEDTSVLTEERHSLEADRRRMLSPLWLMASETLVAMNCFWAALSFYLPPSNFLLYPRQFALLQSMSANETLLSLVALMSGILSMLGILIALTPWSSSAAAPFRTVGMAMAGGLWILTGTSVMLGNPDSLMGVCGISIGLYSLWHVIRLTV